jgi:hypothetical protein
MKGFLPVYYSKEQEMMWHKVKLCDSLSYIHNMKRKKDQVHVPPPGRQGAHGSIDG